MAGKSSFGAFGRPLGGEIEPRELRDEEWGVIMLRWRRKGSQARDWYSAYGPPPTDVEHTLVPQHMIEASIDGLKEFAKAYEKAMREAGGPHF